MHKAYILVLIFHLAFGLIHTAQSQEKKLIYDTAAIKKIKPDAMAINDYKGNKDFIYHTPKPVNTSFWKKLFNKIGEFFETIFGKKATPYIAYIFFALLFAFLLYKLFQNRLQPIFQVSESSRIRITVKDPEINANFDLLINEALTKNDYNLAVRYNYLKLLKQLDINGMIKWRTEKTSGQYASEIPKIELRQNFIRVAYIFDYVWYGKMNISPDLYKIIDEQFRQTTHLISE